MEKDFSYEKETLEKFQAMIDSKEVNIKSVGDLSSNHLKDIVNKLGIYHSKKSNEMMKTDVINLSKIILGGFQTVNLN